MGNNIGVHVAQNRGTFSVLASGNGVCVLVYFNLDVAGDTNVGSGPTLEANTIADNAVTEFAQPFELIFRYDEIENPSELRFAFLNEETGQWEPVPTSVDTNTGRIIGVVDRIGEFALFIGDITDIPTIYLPLIKR